MKRHLTSSIVLFVVAFAACKKTGGSSSSDNTPYGLSMFINGKFSTFNNYPSVDTTDNSFFYTGTGDSSCCTGMRVSWGMNKADYSPLTPGIYPASGYDLQNQSDWTIYDYANWGYTSNVGFVAFPDSVIITKITDSTITGTFSGTCTGEIQNQNYPYNIIDSVMTVTNGKFHLKKY